SIDESLQWLHNFERLQDLQKQLIWPPVQELDPKTYVPELAVSRQYCENLLAHPRRKLIHEGVLFHNVQKQPVPLDSCVFCDVGPQDISKAIENYESIQLKDMLRCTPLHTNYSQANAANTPTSTKTSTAGGAPPTE
uniref:Uncharacterized protein n=1 Tax=Romanomermis culicivorax TaxID=13658 RepID=A0A915KYP1_ROMCU